MMTLIIHLFHSRDVVVVISQLLFVAHAVVPVAQFLIPSATDIKVMSRFHVERICKNDASQNGQQHIGQRTHKAFHHVILKSITK